MGAEMTQAIVVSVVPNSTAIERSAIVRIVIGKVVANIPASAAASTQLE